MDLLVVKQNGESLSIPAREGETIMELIRSAGVDDLLALCGGCCSCATCHVYIDENQQDLLSKMDESEDDLLSGSSHRLPTSRLSCQITFSAALSGLKVTIAPED